jgi:hypothetical protein
MTKFLIFISKVLKRRSGHRRHFGYHTTFAGHLVDSCNSIPN